MCLGTIENKSPEQYYNENYGGEQWIIKKKF
jgi:hypothetical protein